MRGAPGIAISCAAAGRCPPFPGRSGFPASSRGIANCQEIAYSGFGGMCSAPAASWPSGRFRRVWNQTRRVSIEVRKSRSRRCRRSPRAMCSLKSVKGRHCIPDFIWWSAGLSTGRRSSWQHERIGTEGAVRITGILPKRLFLIIRHSPLQLECGLGHPIINPSPAPTRPDGRKPASTPRPPA